MGWSSAAAMATRYQHVLDCIRRDVADQVGDLAKYGLQAGDQKFTYCLDQRIQER
jgi:hypothetical protein